MTEIARLQIAVDATGVKSATDSLSGLAKGADKAELNIRSLAKGFAGLLAGASVADAVRSAVIASRDFNQALSQLSAITGSTGEDLAFMAKQAEEIGRTTSTSAVDAVKAFQLMASAKPELLNSAEALASVTKEALALSQAATIDMPQAANVLGTSLNQFGAGADSASQFINVLAAGAKFGASEIVDTADALKNSGAAAAAAGVSFEGVNAAIQALAAGGLKGAEAGTGLRSVILKLESDTNQKLRPSVVGLTDALVNLSKENLSVTDLTEKFGLESVTAAATLMKQSASLDTLEQSIKGTNTAYEQASVNNDNLANDQLVLTNSISVLAAAFGDELEPSVRSSTQALTGAVHSITDNLDSLLTAATVVGTVFAGKLAGSATASATAFIAQSVAAARATVTVNSFGMVTARTTVAMNVATAATLTLNRAMSVLGGPVGLAITGISLLVMGISSYQSRSVAAQKDTQDLANKISTLATAAERAQDRFSRLLEGADKLSKKEMSSRLVELEATLKRVQGQGKSFQRMFEKGTGSQGMIDGNIAAAKVLQDEINVIKAKLGVQQTEQNEGAKKYTDRLQEQVNMLGAVTEREKVLAQIRTGMLKVSPAEQERLLLLADQIDKQAALEASTKRLTKADDSASKSIDTQVAALQAQAAAYLMTSTEAEVYALKQKGANETQIAAARAAAEQIAAMEELRAAQSKAVADAEQRTQIASQVDPMIAERARFQERMAQIRMLENEKVLSEQRANELMLQAATDHDTAMAALQEENFRRQSYANELLMASLDQLQQGATNAFVGLLTGANNSQEAIQQLASSILNEAVGALVEMGIAQVKSIIMGQAAQTAATATSVAAGAATAAAWTPAAAAASIASFGGAAASGLASMASAIPAMIGLLSFEGGGFTGTGSRSGGMDGKGGFMAMVHPNETIIDHTKSQSTGGSGVTVNVIQSSEKAGTQETKQNADGSQSVDVFVSDIYGDGPRARALQNAFGLKRSGK